MDLLTGTQVDTWVMVLVVSVLTLSLIVGVPLARAAGRRRGHRLSHQESFQTGRERAKDTALFLAALVPSLLVWLAVMGVSFIGLTGFANDVMQWNHWTNILVPLSLDGISVSFGAWAFVAVKRGRHPGRAYKIVLAAATVSATLNFVHGRDKWSIWAGLYLAFLSMAGMAMFHELLDQFMAGLDDEVALKTRYPRFGQRWLYAPLSTFAARRAWIVHPPEESLRPSVRNALDHLQDVREAKRQHRLAGALRTREEQQAKLVEVHAKAEVRRARQAGRRPEHFMTPPGVNGVVPSQFAKAAAPVLLEVPRELTPQAQLFREPQPLSEHQPLSGHQPLSEHQPLHEQPLPREPQRETRSFEPVLDPALKAELEQVLPIPPQALGRNPLADQFAAGTQQMIGDALSLGEQVTAGQIRDYVLRQHGHRVSVTWAQSQLRTARSRDTFGVDADLP